MEQEQSGDGPPRIGDRLTVTVERLASGGDGIARTNGMTVFVPYSAPGDIAEVEIVLSAKNFVRARILSIREPGPDRVTSACPLAGHCPGCQFQHLRYEAQLAAKQEFVRDGLERIGRVKGVEVRPTLGMETPWHYRNKGEFIANIQDGQVRLGYHGDEETPFIPLVDCAIQHPISMKILQATEEVATNFGIPLAQLITRVSPSEQSALAILVCWDWHARLPEAATALQTKVPELAGVLWSRVRGRSVVRRTLAEIVVGSGKLHQRLGPWEYSVSAESFFQVNSVQAVKLIDLAAEFTGDMRELHFADGYCGVGTFLMPLANRALRAIGIEEHPIALKDAEENIARYALHDVHLYEGRVDTILTRLVRKGRSVDVIVLDPPRKGAGRQVLETLRPLGVERAVLVSCDPATLGRDIGDLASLGYRIEVIQPVDMFPQTWHIESIALAVRI